MATQSLVDFQFELDLRELRQRIWQVIPGLLSWTTLIGLTVLAFWLPFWIAIFVIVYDVYILIRAVYMSIHLVYAYNKLKRSSSTPWRKKLEDLPTQEVDWRNVHHFIVLPTYDEEMEVLRGSIRALAGSDFPLSQMHVVVGFEERSGEDARSRAAALHEEFDHVFGTFMTTFHPDGSPGERRVKSANATWALRRLEEKTAPLDIPVRHILVSNFDSDTVVHGNYFSYLTHVFITHPDRYHVSYQPIPLYNNNLWDAPAFSRVIATGSTFWQLIESTRPERLVTFSSHSMTLQALHDVGYWQRDIVSEDSRIFWQCLLRYNDRYRTEPLYTTVSMDAALTPTLPRTLVSQYRQQRRWAWGIENFPYLVEGFISNKSIPWRRKAMYLFRTLEGHYSWATAPIIVAGLGWLPILFGGPEFHTTVLSYSLPFITRTLMTAAMFGLVISASIAFMLLPQKPERVRPWRYGGMVLQWALVPVMATVLSAFPALDAETRLMLGRDLNFHVMQKTRRV
ncbi:MAG: glycosyltransferase family 2 protein [Patescibacteria group bacterium]